MTDYAVHAIVTIRIPFGRLKTADQISPISPWKKSFPKTAQTACSYILSINSNRRITSRLLMSFRQKASSASQRALSHPSFHQDGRKDPQMPASHPLVAFSRNSHGIILDPALVRRGEKKKSRITVNQYSVGIGLYGCRAYIIAIIDGARRRGGYGFAILTSIIANDRICNRRAS